MVSVKLRISLEATSPNFKTYSCVLSSMLASKVVFHQVDLDLRLPTPPRSSRKVLKNCNGLLWRVPFPFPYLYPISLATLPVISFIHMVILADTPPRSRDHHYVPSFHFILLCPSILQVFSPQCAPQTCFRTSKHGLLCKTFVSEVISSLLYSCAAS